jgi:hypothetical protein
MKSSAAKKKITLPTVSERFEALLREANANDLANMIEAINAKTDEALDKIAEDRRPKGEGGIPLDWMKQNLQSKSFGPCACRSYLSAIEEK